tara:strand:- start:498 stop:956 length:459 start_codon:yes stop_codon:yes gene_type:complete
MVSHKTNQQEEGNTSSENNNLAMRLKDVSQDRLVEEVISLWDEINAMEADLAAARRHLRTQDLGINSQNNNDRSLIVEYEEKLRVANTKIKRLEKQTQNEKLRRESSNFDQKKIKQLEIENVKLLQNEEEFMILIMDMETHIEKLVQTIKDG